MNQHTIRASQRARKEWEAATSPEALQREYDTAARTYLPGIAAVYGVTVDDLHHYSVSTGKTMLRQMLVNDPARQYAVVITWSIDYRLKESARLKRSRFEIVPYLPPSKNYPSGTPDLAIATYTGRRFSDMLDRLWELVAGRPDNPSESHRGVTVADLDRLSHRVSLKPIISDAGLRYETIMARLSRYRKGVSHPEISVSESIALIGAIERLRDELNRTVR